jgi:hypothetical protein
MAKGPGNEGSGSDASMGLSHWLGSFEKASSEHKKTVIILDHILPFIQSKGINSPRNSPPSGPPAVWTPALAHGFD